MHVVEGLEASAAMATALADLHVAAGDLLASTGRTTLNEVAVDYGIDLT